MVARVCNEDGAVAAAPRDAVRVEEAGRCAAPVHEAMAIAACDRLDVAVAKDATDGVVVRVCDEHLIVRCRSETHRRAEARRPARAVIVPWPDVSWCTPTSDGADVAENGRWVDRRLDEDLRPLRVVPRRELPPRFHGG